MDIRECYLHNELAPSPVSPEEILLRLIFYPDHVKDNKLLPEAIPRDDLRSRGFSVQRSNFVTRELLDIRIRNYCDKSAARRFEGIADLLCKKIREIKDDDSCQAFIVIDDAREDDVGHAIILFSRKYSDSTQKKLRKNLLDQMSEIRSLEASLGS